LHSSVQNLAAVLPQQAAPCTALLLLQPLCSSLFCPADEKVQAEKDKVSKALKNDEAAWAEYLAEYGAGSVMNLITGPKTKDLPEAARAAAFKNNFKAALREMDRLNKQADADGDNVAYGINSHAHLSADDFAALRATGLLTAAKRRATRRAGVQSAAVAAAAAAAAEEPAVVAAADVGAGGRKLKQTCPTGQVSYSLGSSATPAAVDWVSNGFVTPVKNQVRQSAA
jgi:hypothetical protein